MSSPALGRLTEGDEAGDGTGTAFGFVVVIGNFAIGCTTGLVAPDIEDVLLCFSGVL
jgi:hypothetical protein